MTPTFNMIAPNPGQLFSGNPSGNSYTADNYGAVNGVAARDVEAMQKAGCGFQTGPAKYSLTVSTPTFLLLYPNFGDGWYDLNFTVPCTLSIGPSSPSSPPQLLRVIIRPNGNQVTLPSSNGTLINAGGAPPTPSTTQITSYEYASDNIGAELGGV